ncbi:hypothetical protein HPP92_009338 [Vanilla planifolia]|uniref:Uncharacterized protein n=1 Tax=Vanilla planifolia TaxID=51239 RepID=A0A835RBC3_VANPL|nr:hypothetical protein HPP92_009338 [Vanilla planifolia]
MRSGGQWKRSRRLPRFSGDHVTLKDLQKQCLKRKQEEERLRKVSEGKESEKPRGGEKVSKYGNIEESPNKRSNRRGKKGRGKSRLRRKIWMVWEMVRWWRSGG